MELTMLFKEVLSLSLMGSIVAALIILTKALIKDKISAKWHYYIWMILILRLIIPYTPESELSVFNLLPPNIQSSTVEKDIDEARVQPLVISNVDAKESTKEAENLGLGLEGFLVDDSTSIPQEAKLDQAFEIMSILWLVGTVLILLYIVIVNIKFHSKVRMLPDYNDEETIRILEDCKSIINIKNKVSIIVESGLKTPSLYGLIKPKILIPIETIKNLSEDDKRYIFLHELSHLKRKDIFINWTVIFVIGLHWFNPIVWYAVLKVREDCEVACDADVLRYLGKEEHRRYGESIINILNIISRPNLNPAILGMANYKSNLRKRIRMIQSYKKFSFKWSIIAVLLFVLIGIIGLTSGVVVAKDKKDVQSSNISRDIDIEQSYDAKKFLDEFKDQNHSLKYTTKMATEKSHLFETAPLLLTIDRQNSLSIYEYDNNQDMEQQAAKIRFDGATIGSTTVRWGASPHFYKKGRILIGYFGRNKEFLTNIESLMGKPFAGASLKTANDKINFEDFWFDKATWGN